MKLIVDLEKKILRMLENERSIFRGEYGADKLELYINKTLENEFPTITALLSNGRKIGPYSSDEGFKQQVVDEVQYTVASFTLSKQNGFTLSEGKMMITIWMNSNGKKEAIGNVTLNVINTTAFDDGDIIISGDVEGTLVNYRVELENLQGQVNGFNASLNNLQYKTNLLDDMLDTKADKSSIDELQEQLLSKANTSYVDSTFTDIANGNFVVGKAEQDGEGNNIADTYARNNIVNSTFTAMFKGDIVVGKAKADAEGNNIVDTYATKSMLTSAKKILEDDLKEGTLVPLKAEQDGEGNNIADTYAKDNYVNSTFTAISNGNFVVGKAQHDKEGNDIGATYAKKSETTDKFGKPNGIATLDDNCKVPASQLPSYVDDVIEGKFINTRFYDVNNNILTPESGKIYLEVDTNKTYRWSGSQYVSISSSIALGETSATAYAGDKGKKNAEDIAEIKETLPTLQPKLTAGNGISISADGTISISLPNGDEVAY